MRALRWIFTDEESDPEDEEDDSERHWAAQDALLQRRALLRQTAKPTVELWEQEPRHRCSDDFGSESEDSVREWVRRELESESEAASQPGDPALTPSGGGARPETPKTPEAPVALPPAAVHQAASAAPPEQPADQRPPTAGLPAPGAAFSAEPARPPTAAAGASAPVVHLQVLVPTGIQPGQQLVFTTPDGQQMMATARQAAAPGSLIHIACHVSAPAAEADGAAPRAAPRAAPARRQAAPAVEDAPSSSVARPQRLSAPEPSSAADKSLLASRDARCQKLEQDLKEAREAAAAATNRMQELAARCLAAEAEARELGDAVEGLARERDRALRDREHLVDRRLVSVQLSEYLEHLAMGRQAEAEAAMKEVWRILSAETAAQPAPAPSTQARAPASVAAVAAPPRRTETASEPQAGMAAPTAATAEPAAASPQHSAQAERPAAPSVAIAPSRAATARGRRLDGLLSEPVVRKAALAEIAWVGVPEERQRSEAWQLLLGYRPLSKKQRGAALQARRYEYQEMRCGIYEGSSCSSKGGGKAKAAALQQIRIDLPRTEVCRSSPAASELQAIVDSELVQALMERVLFVWSTQEPAAGYVQGMNDVLLPLLFVFLSERAGASLADGRLCLAGVEALPAAVLDEVEADCYWCLTAILGDIVDHYVPGQPGLRHAADLLDTQLREVDSELVENIALQGADLNIAVMKWLGCLMVRELPVHLCARLWDTCIAESALGVRRGFSDFLVGLFVSLLASHGDSLRTAEFDQLMEFFLRPPVAQVGLGGLDVLISEAFMHISKMAQPWGAQLQAAAAPDAPAELSIEHAELAEDTSPRSLSQQQQPHHHQQLEVRRLSSRFVSPTDLPQQPPKLRAAASSVATTAPTASLLGSTGSRCSGSQFGEDHATSEGSGPEGRAFSCGSGGAPPFAAASRDHLHDSSWERLAGAAEGPAAQARKLDTLMEASEAAEPLEAQPPVPQRALAPAPAAVAPSPGPPAPAATGRLSAGGFFEV